MSVVEPIPADVQGQETFDGVQVRLCEEIRILDVLDGLILPGSPVEVGPHPATRRTRRPKTEEEVAGFEIRDGDRTVSVPITAAPFPDWRVRFEFGKEREEAIDPLRLSGVGPTQTLAALQVEKGSVNGSAVANRSKSTATALRALETLPGLRQARDDRLDLLRGERLQSLAPNVAAHRLANRHG